MKYMLGFAALAAVGVLFDAPDQPSDGRQIRIVSTELANTVAQVKVTSSTPRGAFTDYLSLARFGGEWKIVNKTFHFEPKR
jgi:hypothetical protein